MANFTENEIIDFLLQVDQDLADGKITNEKAIEVRTNCLNNPTQTISEYHV